MSYTRHKIQSINVARFLSLLHRNPPLGTIMDDIPLTSLSLTHVQFDARDKFAYLLAYITLSPLAILVFYASIIVSRREIAGISILAGQLLNEGLNAILKEYLQIARPNSHLGAGYGMPSSHAQFIWFFAIFGSLYLWKRITVDYPIQKAVVSVAMFALALLVSYSRVYLGYHTLLQVIAGTTIGCIFGIAWYGFTEYGLRRSGLIQWVLDHPVGKLLYLRDMRTIDNVARWEYKQWEQQMGGRNKGE
ncbi:phosphatidic acid phosphatase type 2/haloperoxidase [Fennellomyces sp. T-0311]|nr:phosphatidic acid phosphatase type 2/haloperoxidase [Fennellomyces sp. T-0311]